MFMNNKQMNEKKNYQTAQNRYRKYTANSGPKFNCIFVKCILLQTENIKCTWNIYVNKIEREYTHKRKVEWNGVFITDIVNTYFHNESVSHLNAGQIFNLYIFIIRCIVMDESISN